MIQVERLTKRYRDLVAVDNLTFEVGKGEILGFLGPNGAGKSTTMKILTGFMPATSGSARIAGFDVFESPVEVKRRVGYLPENPPLYPELSVRACLRFACELKGVPSKALPGEIDRVAALTRIDGVMDRLVGNMSKGFKQRVGLAQALVGNPEVLVLDEPTSGLDPRQYREVRQLIRSLAGQHTIILSTHTLPEVTAVCQKVLIINEGRMVACDSLENLHREHGESSLEDLFIKLTADKQAPAAA